ncbi:MAG: NAD(P)/FAD-dependent oxidoreductase [Pyrinomonadaceae bacterium]
MKNKSKIRNPKSEIVVVGAGPAGASLAIRLVREGFRVRLIEREKFPRHKLCGEFISPECLRHFGDLGVLDEMLAVGGDRIAETVFYEPGGRSVSVASQWFGGEARSALSISRSEMDLRLLERARALGVEVLEETQVVDLLTDKGEVCGVRVRNGLGEITEISADLTVDATGRSRVLTKIAGRKEVQGKSKIQNPKSKIQNPLVGFKAHLKNVRLEAGVCEIYFFPGGYGGLSYIEDGLANHCFLIEAETVRRFGGDAGKIVENVVSLNKRAALTLKDAEPVFDWLAVSIDGFGRRDLTPLPNLLTVGDAAAFIDPFTGSGMLMALESAEILSRIVAENRFSPEKIEEIYKLRHSDKFQKRLRICALLRRLASAPGLTRWGISALSLSRTAREMLARATRNSFSTGESKR